MTRVTSILLAVAALLAATTTTSTGADAAGLRAAVQNQLAVSAGDTKGTCEMNKFDKREKLFVRFYVENNTPYTFTLADYQNDGGYVVTNKASGNKILDEKKSATYNNNQLGGDLKPGGSLCVAFQSKDKTLGGVLTFVEAKKKQQSFSVNYAWAKDSKKGRYVQLIPDLADFSSNVLLSPVPTSKQPHSMQHNTLEPLTMEESVASWTSVYSGAHVKATYGAKYGLETSEETTHATQSTWNVGLEQTLKFSGGGKSSETTVSSSYAHQMSNSMSETFKKTATEEISVACDLDSAEHPAIAMWQWKTASSFDNKVKSIAYSWDFICLPQGMRPQCPKDMCKTKKQGAADDFCQECLDGWQA